MARNCNRWASSAVHTPSATRLLPNAWKESGIGSSSFRGCLIGRQAEELGARRQKLGAAQKPFRVSPEQTADLVQGIGQLTTIAIPKVLSKDEVIACFF